MALFFVLDAFQPDAFDAAAVGWAVALLLLHVANDFEFFSFLNAILRRE